MRQSGRESVILESGILRAAGGKLFSGHGEHIAGG
jgi:hypothetical protein